MKMYNNSLASFSRKNKNTWLEPHLCKLPDNKVLKHYFDVANSC